MIFVDTSFWIATDNERDAHHEAAVALARRCAGDPWVTTNHVIGEAWTWLQRKSGHVFAVRFIDRIERSARLRVDHVAGDAEREAWAWLRRHDERGYSFVDATSIAVMRDLGIRDALAFDGDFTAAGFNELRA